MSSTIKYYKLLWAFIIMLFAFNGYSYGQSIEFDKKIGAENAKIVEVQMGLYNDENMTAYVRTIGDRLVAKIEDNPFEFSFYIVDSPIPNAFALPGGYIYVTRGLLSLINIEDELAGILAHEIIHVTERHSVKQMRGGILPAILELPGNVVGSVVDKDLGNLLNSPLTTSNKLLLASYSRKHETVADMKGMELASKAGYEPMALGDILERLSMVVELLTEQKEQKSYFDSHPYTPKRVEKIEKNSSQLEWTESEKIAEDFPVPLEGLVFGSNPSKGIFREEVFIHPDLNFTISFPSEWICINQAHAVGAIHEEKLGAIFLGSEDPSISPEKHASKFEEELMKSHERKPAVSEARTVNHHPGYLITLEDKTGDEVMYIHILWLKMDDKLFKLIGIAPRSLETDLKEVALSLRTLKQKERNGVEIRTLLVVRAKDGENIEEISKRSGGVLDIKLLSLMNGLDEESELKSGQAVKIVTQQKYEHK